MNDEQLVPQYPKGHTGRLLVTLAAIDYLARPTATSVADLTGLSKGNIDMYVQSLNTELGTVILKTGAEYSIRAWGKMLNPVGVRKLLKVPLNRTMMDARILGDLAQMIDDAAVLQSACSELVSLFPKVAVFLAWREETFTAQRRYPGLSRGEIALRWLQLAKQHRLIAVSDPINGLRVAEVDEI